MIQRIQSIYLFLAALASGATFLPPLSIGSFQNAAATVVAAQDGLLNVFDNTGLMVLTASVSILALITLFLFKKRPLQLNIIKALLAMALVGLILLGFMVKTNLDAFNSNDPSNGILTLNPLGFIAPFVAIVLSVLAYRSIKKDEILVRSADRLR